MAISPPALIAIDHDDYYAQTIGKTPDGRQFFLTTPFVPGFVGAGRREFVALYVFDTRGHLLEADIEEVPLETSQGPGVLPGNANPDAGRDILARKLAGLGQVQFGRIEIRPFQVEQFGIAFGLIPQEPEDDGEFHWVSVEPGDYMSFSSPWDSGDYDT